VVEGHKWAVGDGSKSAKWLLVDNDDEKNIDGFDRNVLHACDWSRRGCGNSSSGGDGAVGVAAIGTSTVSSEAGASISSSYW
jgi:hypothetical protein